ncbi:MAG: hypothetical protein ACO218_09675 [Steroidobacteraceae bacterium]
MGTNVKFSEGGAIAVLDDVGDVSAASPSSNDVLTWNGSAWVPAAAPGAGGGEANTASNVGAGAGVYKQKTGTDLELRSIVGGTLVTATQNVNDVTLDVALDPDDLDDTSTTNKFTTAADISKLAGIEAAADVTDEANVVAALDGATLTDAGRPATGDKVLIQDASASDALKTVNASEVAKAATFAGVTLASADYSAAWGDRIVLTAGANDVNMPAAANAGQFIEVVNRTGNVITINRNGTDLFDDAATTVSLADGDAVSLIDLAVGSNDILVTPKP